MGNVSVVPVFVDRSISKNASIVLATPIHLWKCGPNTVFWLDMVAPGGGKIGVAHQIADHPDDTFHTPVSASIVNRWKAGYGGNNGASRDRVAANIVGTKWVKFKADELNASPITNLNADLIISR